MKPFLIFRTCLRTSLALAGVLHLGCSAEQQTERLHQTSRPIDGGRLDTENEGVVAIAVQVDRSVALCTGTVIAPNLLLTARHCIAPTPSSEVVCGEAAFGEPYPASDIFFAFDPVLDEATQWFEVDEVFVPPNGNDVCGSDIALLVSSDTLPDSVPIRVPRIDLEVERLEDYTAVGYGVTAADRGAGVRRFRSDLRISCAPGACDGAITDAEFLGEIGICQGDSGGPALGLGDRVLGVASRGGEECTAPIYSAVTAWSDWIRDVAVLASVAGDYPPATWALTGVTEAPVPPSRPGGEPVDPPEDGGFLEPTPLPGEAGGQQGDACESSANCAPGFSCVPSAGASICAAACTTQEQCGDGLVCVEGACRDLFGGTPAVEGDDDGGCSVSGRPALSSWGWSTGGMALLGLAAARTAARRRGKSRRRVAVLGRRT